MAPSYRNRVGLSQEHLRLLEQDLGQVSVVSPDLPEELLRYVLYGEGEEVLERLATTPPKQIPTEWLPGVTVQQAAAPSKRPRTEFYVKPASDDPHFYLRLVRVYQAIWAHNSIRTPVGWASLAEAPWLEPFLFELNTLRGKASDDHLPELAGVTVPFLERMLVADGRPADLLIRALLAQYEEKHGSKLLEMLLLPVPGLGKSLVEHSDEVISWLDQARARPRVGLLELLHKAEAPVEPFLETVVKLAVGPAQVVREAAAGVLAAAPKEAAERLGRFVREGKSDERTHAAEALDCLQQAGQPEEAPGPVPVESLRGLEAGIFGYEGKIMVVRAAFDKVQHSVAAIRSKSDLQWGVWLVRLRGHNWTIVKSFEEPLGQGVVSEQGARQISRELATDVVFCLTEDTSGVIVGCLFRAGEPLLKMDNINGIAHQSTDYEAPPRDPDEEPDDFEFEYDVTRHLDRFLRTEGTYLPSVWPEAPPGTGVGVTVQGLEEADFARVEYIASYQ